MTTLREVQELAPLVDAVRRGAKITIALDGDVTRLLEGTLRAFTPSEGTGNHLSGDEDITKAFVRVSSTFEHWFPVRELTASLRDGLAAIDF